jgi:hypothetical protein
MRRLLIALTALMLGVVTAAPAAAIPTTGNQEYLWSTIYLTEGEPFFIQEGGYTQTCPDVSFPSGFDFILEIDGVAQMGYRTIKTYNSQDFGLSPGDKWIPCFDDNGNLTLKAGVLMWVSKTFNFPEGLPTGVYTFTGHWTYPDGEVFTWATTAVVSPAV